MRTEIRRLKAKISEFKREAHCYKTLRCSTEDKQTDNSQLGDAYNGWYFGFSILINNKNNNMERKDIRKFCADFAHNFIASECMMKEFANLTCGDAQEVKIHLQNTLDMDLQDFLDEQGSLSE